jgi:hypothetical protein
LKLHLASLISRAPVVTGVMPGTLRLISSVVLHAQGMNQYSAGQCLSDVF